MYMRMQQVMCGTCHSFSAHLYERLGAMLGPWDGMTMTRDFCAKFTAACSKKVDGRATIEFPNYSGASYCEMHVGSRDGEDNYWSFPYTEGAHKRKHAWCTTTVCGTIVVRVWYLVILNRVRERTLKKRPCNEVP